MGRPLTDAEEASGVVSDDPADQVAYLQAMTFIRSARPGDDRSVVKARGTLWRGPDDQEVWMHPSGVMQHGLTDKLREGLAAEGDPVAGPAFPDVREPQEDKQACERCGGEFGVGGHGPGFCRLDRREGMPEHIRNRGVSAVLGGHTEDWRWSIVEDLVVIDNKPFIERTRGVTLTDAERDHRYERVRLPVEVLLAITNTAP